MTTKDIINGNKSGLLKAVSVLLELFTMRVFARWAAGVWRMRTLSLQTTIDFAILPVKLALLQFRAQFFLLPSYRFCFISL